MIDEQRRKFGKHVASLRRQARWTQLELAQAAGLTENTISKIEQGRFNVPFDVINRIAVVLGGELQININQFI